MFRSSFRPYTTNGRGIVSRSYAKRDQSQSVPLRLSDEISILKKEKQNLIQEKSLLKAKIVRLTNKAKRPRQSPQKFNIQYSNSLEKELRQAEQLTAAKRSEIALIKLSDRAAIVDELQEECLMLHMELIRMKKQKIEAEKQRKEAYKKLVNAQEEYSKEVLANQKKEIAHYIKEIAAQKQRNFAIALKLQKKEEARDVPDERTIVMKTSVESIEKSIQQEEEETKQIEEEIKQVTEEQTKRIKELEERLRSLQ